MKTLVLSLGLWFATLPAFAKIDKSFVAHRGGILKINVSPEALFFHTAGEDGKARTWWFDCLCSLSTFNHGTNLKVYDAAFLPGRKSVSTALGGLLAVWNTETGDPIQTLKGHDEYVSHITVSWDAKRFYTSGADDKIIEWDLETLKELGRYETKSPVGVLEAALPDRLFTVGLRGLLLWNRGSKKVEATVLDLPYAFAAAQSGDSFFLAGDTANNFPVQRRDRKTGALQATYLGAKQTIRGLATSPDGRWVGASEWQGPVLVWEQATGALVYRSDSEVPHTLSLAFVPEGRGLLVGDTEGRVNALRF